MILFADGEREVVEWKPGVLGRAGLAGETLTLTDQRVVAHNSSSHESMPLATIGSVRSVYARDINHLLVGIICILVGLICVSGYKAVERIANRTIAGLEKKITQEPKVGTVANPAPEADDKDRLNVPIGIIWLLMMPLFAFGVYRLHEGARGRTSLTIFYAGGSYRVVRFGRDAALLEFGQDVGRALVE